MSKNGNVQTIRKLYDDLAAGDVDSVIAAMDSQIEWNEAESFPYDDSNPYVGPSAVVDGVFARLGTEWEGFSVVVEQLIAGEGDVVLTLGRYQATHRATGRSLDAQLAHVWWLHGGKVIRFQQYTDTAQVREVAGLS